MSGNQLIFVLNLSEWQFKVQKGFKNFIQLLGKNPLDAVVV